MQFHHAAHSLLDKRKNSFVLPDKLLPLKQRALTVHNSNNNTVLIHVVEIDSNKLAELRQLYQEVYKSALTLVTDTPPIHRQNSTIGTG